MRMGTSITGCPGWWDVRTRPTADASDFPRTTCQCPNMSQHRKQRRSRTR